MQSRRNCLLSGVWKNKILNDTDESAELLLIATILTCDTALSYLHPPGRGMSGATKMRGTRMLGRYNYPMETSQSNMITILLY